MAQSSPVQTLKPMMADEQKVLMIQAFEEDSLPDFEKRQALAARLGMSPRSVQIWFQNRRQRLKPTKPASPGADGVGSLGEKAGLAFHSWRAIKSKPAKPAKAALSKKHAAIAQAVPIPHGPPVAPAVPPPSYAAWQGVLPVLVPTTPLPVATSSPTLDQQPPSTVGAVAAISASRALLAVASECASSEIDCTAVAAVAAVTAVPSSLLPAIAPVPPAMLVPVPTSPVVDRSSPTANERTEPCSPPTERDRAAASDGLLMLLNCAEPTSTPTPTPTPAASDASDSATATDDAFSDGENAPLTPTLRMIPMQPWPKPQPKLATGVRKRRRNDKKKLFVWKPLKMRGQGTPRGRIPAATASQI